MRIKYNHIKENTYTLIHFLPLLKFLLSTDGFSPLYNEWVGSNFRTDA